MNINKTLHLPADGGRQLWNECIVKKRSFAMIEEAIADGE